MVILSTPLAAQGMSAQCLQIFGAMGKLWDRPFHMYMVDTAGTDARLHGGKPTVSESIFINGAELRDGERKMGEEPGGRDSRCERT